MKKITKINSSLFVCLLVITKYIPYLITLKRSTTCHWIRRWLSFLGFWRFLAIWVVLYSLGESLPRREGHEQSNAKKKRYKEWLLFEPDYRNVPSCFQMVSQPSIPHRVTLAFLSNTSFIMYVEPKPSPIIKQEKKCRRYTVCFAYVILQATRLNVI